jgi:sugar lactone lactonase YvrE
VIDLGTGMIDRFAGTGERATRATAARPRRPACGPRDLEIGPDGDLYFADTDNGKVRAIDLETGVIRTVVGTGELGIDEVERPPGHARFMLRRPFGIAFDPDGNLYVMDTLNSRIVKVAR